MKLDFIAKFFATEPLKIRIPQRKYDNFHTSFGHGFYQCNIYDEEGLIGVDFWEIGLSCFSFSSVSKNPNVVCR